MTDHNTMHLIISSVSESLFDGAALSVIVPGSAGEMTILPNHEPLITTLQSGKVTVRVPGQSKREFHINSGVLETSAGRAVVLV